MKKYEIRKNTVEISYKNRSEIKTGCTMGVDDQDPEIIKSFDTKEEAIKELNNYKSDIQNLSQGAGSYYLVTEFYVEENEYDEDGDWVNGGDIYGFTNIKIELVDKESYNVIGVFDDFEDAEQEQNKQDRECYLSFN